MTMEEYSEMYLDKDLGEYDGIYDGICYYNDKIEICGTGSFTKDIRYFKVTVLEGEKDLKVARINMRKPEYIKTDYKLPDDILDLVIHILNDNSIESIDTYPGKTNKSIWANLNYYNNEIRLCEGVIKDLHGEPEVLPIPDYAKLNR